MVLWFIKIKWCYFDKGAGPETLNPQNQVLRVYF